MKHFLIALLLVPFFGSAQSYVDLLKLGYGRTFNNEFEGPRSPDTYITTLEADFTVPVVLNEKHALITGLSFSRNHVQLFPDNDIELFRPGYDADGFAALISTTLKLGVASTFNSKWSSTIVLLPKIASDYKNISGDDFYFGGFAVLKMQKTKQLKYRFGIYASGEAFGFFTTPIIGWYYLSPNGQFEMDMSLPIAADVNYTSGAFTYGLDYYGIGRSFNINSDDGNTYVDLSTLDFAAYLQYNAFEKSVLLRAKIGYSTNDYEVYLQGDKIDLGVSAFSFGDDREQLNPTIKGSPFVKLEAIYRFDIPGNSEKKENNE